MMERQLHKNSREFQTEKSRVGTYKFTGGRYFLFPVNISFSFRKRYEECKRKSGIKNINHSKTAKLSSKTITQENFFFR